MDSGDMKPLTQRKLEADIELALASAAQAYETARKIKIESLLYPVVVAGGLLAGGAALARLFTGL